MAAAPLYKQASGMAATDVAGQVAGIKAQQASLLAAARQQANQTNFAAVAAANYLRNLNLGGQTAQDYANAAAAERAGAAGYSGGLQQTVGDAAAQVQHNLAAIGSPQTALNQSAAAGNALYGLSGNLPATQLDRAGPLVAAQQRALPAQTIGYGQAQANALLGGGQQKAAALASQILAAQARQPGIAQGYLGKLETAANQQAQQHSLDAYRQAQVILADNRQKSLDSFHESTLQAKQDALKSLNVYRQAQVQIASDNARTSQERVQAYANAQAANERIRAFTAQTGRINAQTSRQRANQAPTARIQTFGSDKRGYSYIDASGKLVPLPGPLGKPLRSGSSSKVGGLTRTQALKFSGTALTLAQQAHDGFTDSAGAAHPKLSFADAVLEAQKEGLPPAIYLPALRRFYTVAERTPPGPTYQTPGPKPALAPGIPAFNPWATGG